MGQLLACEKVEDHLFGGILDVDLSCLRKWQSKSESKVEVHLLGGQSIIISRSYYDMVSDLKARVIAELNLSSALSVQLCWNGRMLEDDSSAEIAGSEVSAVFVRKELSEDAACFLKSLGFFNVEAPIGILEIKQGYQASLSVIAEVLMKMEPSRLVICSPCLENLYRHFDRDIARLKHLEIREMVPAVLPHARKFIRLCPNLEFCKIRYRALHPVQGTMCRYEGADKELLRADLSAWKSLEIVLDAPPPRTSP